MFYLHGNHNCIPASDECCKINVKEIGGCLMKRNRIFVLFILVVLSLNGCGLKGTDKTINNNNEAVTKEENKKATTMNRIEPESMNMADWECGTYYSDISAEDMQEYLDKLEQDGWKSIDGADSSTDVVQGISAFTLCKENNLLQIMMTLADTENSMVNSILARLDQGISSDEIKDRKEAVTKEEAQQKIQSNVQELVADGEIHQARENVTGLFEIFIDGAYQKMGLQAFATISEHGFTGCFLIRKGVVSYVPGYLKNACVVDIDQDDVYELMDLYSELDKGIYKNEVVAYEYKTPDSFSSDTQILQRKYENCFVSESGYEELKLKKVDDTSVTVFTDSADYGNLKPEGTTLVLENTKEFPFEQWSTVYDQKLLLNFDKEIPEEPPKVSITADEVSLDYAVQATNWNKKSKDFTIADAFDRMISKNQFIPTFAVNGFETDQWITMNFGDSIPDSIQVYDSMLEDDGSVMYGDKLVLEQAVKIIDRCSVQFKLQQHIALSLSSNMDDYEKDWYRMFRIVCRWGSDECVYAILIKTGKTEKLTELPNLSFLKCEGTYSELSSSWGIGFSIDPSELPKEYVIEWRISDGIIRTWSKTGLKPLEINREHDGYPMTDSQDENNGAVIWTPLTYDNPEDVTLEAYIYKSEEDRSPIAYSKIILKNENGVYQEK
jgi:L-fucose mutarotase/ribose pyranase (RbsD/FucU family)/predicted small lipoprotein YifL